MRHYSELTFNDDKYFRKKGKPTTSDTIYTFDIETTSLFNFNGEWRSFDFDKDASEYSGIEKAGVPYIFMFGVDDVAYYGRDFYDFEKVLKQISNDRLNKIVWVHNLSFEMAFLRDIFDHYTIVDMVCRDVLKPISFRVEELNITFRCSYMLTNMSLDKSAKEYGTYYKKTNDLNYYLSRGETTELTDTELLYCEYDILSLYSIIKYYREKYKHIANIPLTITGEVRKELRDELDYYYFKDKPWALVPDKEIYLKLMATFQGGYVHANILKSNRVLYGVKSKDIASSYPSILLLNKFPCKPFKQYDYDRYQELKDTHAFFFQVRFKNLKSTKYNHYIPFYKCFDVNDPKKIVDNGRVVECADFRIFITDIDLELIDLNYIYDDIEFIEIYGAYKDYLDIRVINYILKLYEQKTTLKGLTDEQSVAIYKNAKSRINSLYGVSCQNPLKNSATFDRDGWHKLNTDDEELFEEFVDDTLEKQKHSFSNLFFYAVGVWVTSFGRANIYRQIMKIDRDVVYSDTDSIKYVGDHDDIFEAYNKEIKKKYGECCRRFNGEIMLYDFMPKDQKGNRHPIGYFEDDGEYIEFKTMGAKKYAYRDEDGLHLTISGVNKKKGIEKLGDDINNFKKGTVFDYNQSGKLTHLYNDEQPCFSFVDYQGNVQYNKQRHGVILQPTTYTLGLTDIYEALIKMVLNMEVRQ